MDRPSAPLLRTAIVFGLALLFDGAAVQHSHAAVASAVGTADSDPDSDESTPTPALEVAPEGDPLWADPTFKKRVTESFAALPDLEPRLSPEEKTLLEAIYPLIGSNPQEAARQLEASTTPASSATLDLLLANLYYQLDQLDAAAERYRAALTKYPSFRRAHKNLGLILVRQGKYEEAIRPLSRTIEMGGGDAVTYGLLGYSYSACEDWLAAEAAYRSALLLQPDSTEWRLGVVRASLRERKFEEAAALTEILIRRQPERAEFWLLQTNAFLGMKEPARAIENLEILSAMGSATTDALYLLGDLYVNDGLADAAAGAYRRALAMDTKHSPDRSLRGAESLGSRGFFAQAREIVRAVRDVAGYELQGENRRKLVLLEARLSLAEGKGGEAVPLLEEAAAAAPLDGEALMLLGQHYSRAGDPDRAVLYYERAETLDAFEAPARLRHAQILIGQSKYDEALPLLRRAQELKPTEDVARLVEQVERIARQAR